MKPTECASHPRRRVCRAAGTPAGAGESPSAHALPWGRDWARQPLRAGQIIVGDTGRRYRIDGLLDGGGFGHVYRASRLASSSDRVTRKVCVKVCTNAADWHGEARMGHLLAGRREVVALLDAFAFGSGPGRTTRYVIVTEWMREGTVGDLVADGAWAGWRPARVRREIRGLLDLLAMAMMHAAGVPTATSSPTASSCATAGWLSAISGSPNML